jgi:transposase-like protein
LHLAKVVIPSIRSLSKHGQEQLASDLGYISNVAKALDVEVEQIEKWRVALEAEERQQQNKTAISGRLPEESGTEVEVEAVEVDQEVAEMLKRMRSNMGRPALAR